jgi:hypothetical protein
MDYHDCGLSYMLEEKLIRIAFGSCAGSSEIYFLNKSQ